MPAVVYFKANTFSFRQHIKTTTWPAPDVWGEAGSSKDAVKHQRAVPLSQHMDLFYPAAGVEPNDPCATRGQQRLLEKDIFEHQLLAFRWSHINPYVTLQYESFEWLCRFIGLIMPSVTAGHCWYPLTVLTFHVRSLLLLRHLTRPKTPGPAPRLPKQSKPVPSKSSIHLHNSILTHLGNFFP